MDAFLQDMRFGLRQLLRQRGSSLVAVITLALGIGVSTAIFSIIDATMLRPLPYPNPEQLVTVNPEETMPDGRVSRATPSMEDMRTWQKSDDVFVQVAGYGSAFRGRVVEGETPERIEVAHYTEDYLPMHGVTPLIGRNFTKEETDPGSQLVALLGYGYWKSRYSGRQDIVGQTVRFDTEVATIIGVLPAWFNAKTPVVLPLRTPLAEYSRRGTGRVSVYARLRPDVTIDQARERLSARMPIRALPNGQQTSNPRVAISSRLESALTYSRTTVNVLAGSVGLILLIACVNVAGLLLARGAARQSELAVRASLGAGRGRLMRQLLTESAVLALIGGALGVLLAWLSLDAIVANVPLSMPTNSPVTLNLTVLAATLALLVPTALLFGLWPAIRLSRVQVGSVLARTGRQRGSALSRRGGQLLIAAEVALAVILVSGAGLMIRSFMRIAAVDLGFARNGLVVMDVLPLDQNPAVHNEVLHVVAAAGADDPGHHGRRNRRQLLAGRRQLLFVRHARRQGRERHVLQGDAGILRGSGRDARRRPAADHGRWAHRPARRHRERARRTNDLRRSGCRPGDHPRLPDQDAVDGHRRRQGFATGRPALDPAGAGVLLPSRDHAVPT